MLRARNMFVARAGATQSGLTRNIEMATLYSNQRRSRTDLRRLFSGGATERTVAVNRMFLDVLRQFGTNTVAKRRHFGCWTAAVAIGLAGCAGMPGTLSADSKPEVKQERVAARAQERWEAMIKGDLNAAYAYLSPASKATIALDLYKAKHKVGLYRKVKVDSVACEAEACTVNLTVTYDYKRFKGIATPLVEKWIIAEGQAWIVDRG